MFPEGVATLCSLSQILFVTFIYRMEVFRRDSSLIFANNVVLDASADWGSQWSISRSCFQVTGRDWARRQVGFYCVSSNVGFVLTSEPGRQSLEFFNFRSSTCGHKHREVTEKISLEIQVADTCFLQPFSLRDNWKGSDIRRTQAWFGQSSHGFVVISFTIFCTVLLVVWFNCWEINGIILFVVCLSTDMLPVHRLAG